MIKWDHIVEDAKGGVPLEDEKIVELYLKRSELAIDSTQQRYGALLLRVAKKITGSEDDAAECLNDALLNLWQNIPPARPRNLRAYACKVIRNLAFKRLTYKLAEKRNVNCDLPLDELEAVLTDGEADAQYQNVDFSMVLDSFLRSLKPESRVVFLKRYFFMDSVPEIAKDLKMSQSKVNSLLWRARNKLKNDLYEKGAGL